ncbi:MAG: penicillin-binding protein [Chitinophagales bacterium]
MNAKKSILWRVWLSVALLMMGAVAIVFQSFTIQVKEGAELLQMADSLTVYSHTIEAERGNIYSDGGALLSTSLPYFEIRMDFLSEAMTDSVFNKNVDSLAYMMRTHFGANSTEGYKQDLIENRQEGNRYYLIKRNVTYLELEEIRQWPFFKEGRYKSGMIVIQKNKREMPFGILAQRTIGYIRDEGKYKVGIEGMFDELLTGVEGQMLMQRIAGGVYIPLDTVGNIEPQQGYDVYMTLDVNMQDLVETALKKGLVEHNANHGCVVVMEVETGKIKAIANLGYNQSGGYYEEDYNYAIGEGTEPGSTFKLMSMAALLDDGHVEINDVVNLEDGQKEYFDRVMKDAYPPVENDVTIGMAFARSSNVGISKLVYEAYKNDYQKFYDKLDDFHLTMPLGVEIKGENDPVIYQPEDWSAVSLPWMSIGYEVSLSPLQILNFYNTIANDGKMMKPYLVSSIKEYDKVIEEFEPIVIDDEVVKASTVADLKSMMELVVLKGSARNIKTDDMALAGKTGTSQIANANTNYNDKVYQASFAGYFPADAPKYSCIVVVNNPKNGKYYGGSVAAPIFQEIAKKIYATGTEMHESIAENPMEGESVLPSVGNMNVEEAKLIYQDLGVSFHADMESGYGVAETKDNSIQASANFITEGIVPNVVGMDLKDALYVLENADLNVEIQGQGKVKYQSLTAGQDYSKGQTIVLELGIDNE